MRTLNQLSLCIRCLTRWRDGREPCANIQQRFLSVRIALLSRYVTLNERQVTILVRDMILYGRYYVLKRAR
jgi:hypothetical protein